MSDAIANSADNGSQSPTTDKLSSVAHDTIDRAAEAGARGEKRLREEGARAAEKAHDAEEQIRETADEWIAGLRSYTRRNPITSAGIAFTAGIIISSLLRR